MGTSLTGLTPATTYDALIKVGDNGPLTGSLKTISDGLGNDSALALSTGSASITGTLTTSSILRGERVQVGTAATLNDPTGVGNTLQFANYSPTVFVTGSADSYIYKNSGAFSGLSAQSLIFQTRSDVTGGGFAFVAGGTPAPIVTMTGSGNVGIGTSSPQSRLETFGASPIVTITDSNTFSSGVARTGGIEFKAFNPSANNTTQSASIYGVINPETGYTQNEGYLTFYTRAKGGSYSEKMRIQAGGGISFNGDTAAANALDDYEEGTFTATLTPSVSGSITTSATFNTWTYTKIGRQVTINGVFVVSSISSPTGAAILIGGLPFTILNNNGAYGAFSCNYYTHATISNSQNPAQHVVNTTQLIINKDASLVAASDEIYVTATYFV